MDARALATVGIVLATYALLALPGLADRAHAHRYLRHLLTRPGIAIAGALLLVALGLVGARAAFAAIDWRILALLLGMMLLVAALDAANAFGVIASRLVALLPTPAKLLAGSMGVVALLSALVLNDAVVLLFTPVLIRAARSMGVSCFPFLCAEALAANLGSAATPTGNPQNAAIALALDISFVDFARALAPLALLCLALGVLYCLLVFRKELAAPQHRAEVARERFTSGASIAVSAGCVALALAGFVAGPALGAPLWSVALAAGTLALALMPMVARVSPVRVARGVDPGILVFFVGLFILLQGVRAAGLAETIGDALQRGGAAGFVLATAALSNTVSNVPAVLLLLPGVETQAQALLLAASSTLAGNATFFGSAATVIVAEAARSRGESFSVARFTLVGFPLAVVTLFLGWVFLR